MRPLVIARSASLDLRASVTRLWPAAQAHWADFVLLAPPRITSGAGPLAALNMKTREVEVNADLLESMGLQASLESILAHEVGHHVAHPGALALDARLYFLQRSMLPVALFAINNLFFDFLVNHHLHRALRDQLVRIYQAGAVDSDPVTYSMFGFYLLMQEEAWGLDPGALVGPSCPDFERVFPGIRADARDTGEDILGLAPSVLLQFLRFVSALTRYITPAQLHTESALGPPLCRPGTPSAEDFADALTPNQDERAAVERAIREGWLRREQAEWVVGKGAQDRRTAGLPSSARGDPVPVEAVMAQLYRRQASRMLVSPPARRAVSVDDVPGLCVPWEVGESTARIAWLPTLIEKGPDLAVAHLLEREWEGGADGVVKAPPSWRLEIFLDVSGSMPDPRKGVNAMTLAAAILALSAVRSGGAVRPVLYSGNVVTTAAGQWLRDEGQILDFLLRYIGGGTVFPFDELSRSVTLCRDRQPTRVVLSDWDFLTNVSNTREAPSILRRAARRSEGFVALLCQSSWDILEELDGLTTMGVSTRVVRSAEDLPAMAALLSREFKEARHDR